MSDPGEPRSKAPAGWYDDPKLPDTRRYWDGTKWTDHRAEKQTVPPIEPKEEPGGCVLALGWLLLLPAPLISFIIGLTLLGKRGSSGVWLVSVSAVVGVLWLGAAGERMN